MVPHHHPYLCSYEFSKVISICSPIPRNYHLSPLYLVSTSTHKSHGSGHGLWLLKSWARAMGHGKPSFWPGLWPESYSLAWPGVWPTGQASTALATTENLEIGQIDIKGAYLNGELTADEMIYMHQLPGYQQGKMICLLLKTLYSLKQSGCRWY